MFNKKYPNEEYQICRKDVERSPKCSKGVNMVEYCNSRADEKEKNKNITNCWKGVNVVEYCKCEGFTDCSTQWDPYDGKSITQAQSDQYKVIIFTCCKMIEIISKRKRNS